MDARRESEPTPMKNRTTVERKSERELVVTRTFNGPARIVFEAWTKPELLKRWWAPKSFGVSFISCEADVRAGAPTVSCSATLPQSSLWSSSVGTSK
jgi:uncharacterized protein YndB with AHSA1/START domain